jgi:hypothetical protein
MPEILEKVIKPEKVTLKDGRTGYFLNVQPAKGAVITVSYVSSKKRKTSAKTTRIKQESEIGRSIGRALSEVKSRKRANNYPKDFDTLMDEL